MDVCAFWIFMSVVPQPIQTEPVDLSINKRPLEPDEVLDIHQGLDLRVARKGKTSGQDIYPQTLNYLFKMT